MPKVEGNWTHLGKVWRFTPTSKLIDGEKYVVTVNKGISSENNVLENDYVFSFIVGQNYNNNKIEISSVSADGIKTVKPDEKITFNYVFNNIEFGKAEIDRFDSIDDFIKFLQNGRIENIEKLGYYEVKNYKTNDNEGIIELKQKLSKGYYLAILKDLNGKILAKEPIQVSEISSYAMETNSETEFNIIILKRNTFTKISEPISGKYQSVIYKLNKDENKEVSYDLHELYDGVYETEVNVNLVEEVRNKYISGYNYNDYTKENEPMYSYSEPISNRKKIKTITSKNGVVEVIENELSTKEDTNEYIYSYYIEFEYKDQNGKDIIDYTYIDNNKNNTDIGYVKGIIEDESYSRINEIYELKNTSFNYYNYFVYRYLLKSDNQKYGIGDKIKLTLAKSTKRGIEEIENKGMFKNRTTITCNK